MFSVQGKIGPEKRRSYGQPFLLPEWTLQVSYGLTIYVSKYYMAQIALLKGDGYSNTMWERENYSLARAQIMATAANVPARPCPLMIGAV